MYLKNLRKNMKIIEKYKFAISKHLEIKENRKNEHLIY